MSRIKIRPDETEKLATQIADVLAYASSLQEIAQKAPVSAQGGTQKNVMREDVAVQFDAQVLLQQAPEREGDYFVVPKIIKQD
jgi:aspartyl-tRNA(Asn)/glutamyl-tRNA(Gln) amidotransferase subunit C